MLAADAEGRGELVQLLSTLFIKYGTAELQRSIEAVTAQACEPVGGAVFSCFDGRKIVKGSIFLNLILAENGQKNYKFNINFRFVTIEEFT